MYSNICIAAIHVFKLPQNRIFIIAFYFLQIFLKESQSSRDATPIIGLEENVEEVFIQCNDCITCVPGSPPLVAEVAGRPMWWRGRGRARWAGRSAGGPSACAAWACSARATGELPLVDTRDKAELWLVEGDIMLSCDWLRTALDLCGLIVILVLCVVLIFILCFLHPCLFCYDAKHHDTLRDIITYFIN